MELYDFKGDMEAAKFLGIGRSLFVKLVYSGEIPYHTIGRRRFYVKSELITYFNKNQHGSK
jgi:excisionase family DNA binding protein